MTVLVAAGRRGVAGAMTYVDGVGSLRAIELLRIAAGPLVIAHLWPFLTDARNGIVYSDRFFQPYAAWYPEVPRTGYLVLLWVAVGAALALSLGIATRYASVYTAGFVAYNLFLSRTYFWHNRAFLLVMLVGLAVLPVGRAWSIDAAIRTRRGLARPATTGPLWPLMLMRFEVVAAFLGSGVSKLIDPDWWGGTVTQLRVVQWRDVAASRGVPDGILDMVATEGFHVWFAKLAVLTELAIGIGLLYRRSRLGAIWVAVLFHVSIELVASVQVFSYVALAALVIWVTPSVGDRTVIVRGGSRSARLIAFAARRLDWTDRFRLRREDLPGPVVTLIDRDGRSSHGGAALRVMLSRLPPTFMLVAPFNLAGLRTLWDRALPDRRHPVRRSAGP